MDRRRASQLLCGDQSSFGALDMFALWAYSGILTEGLRIHLGPVHATGVALEELFRIPSFKLASDRLLHVHVGKKKKIWISVFTVSSSTTPLATSRYWIARFVRFANL